MNERRKMLCVTASLWILAFAGLCTARLMWQDYNLCLRRFFEMPVGPVLAVGFLVSGFLLFALVGFASLLWATE